MKNNDYLAELLFGASSPFTFRNDSTYNPSMHNTNESEYDIETTKDGAYVSFDVPGYTKDNLQIVLENREIKITGKRVFNKKGETKTIKHNFNLNNYHLYDAHIEATVSNGILTLFLPNYVESSKKTINIS